MKNRLLLGHGRTTIPIPATVWKGEASRQAQHSHASLGFMSEEHHRVRDFVVQELPRVGEPLAPEFIAQALDLPGERLKAILDDLEKHMTFLFRNERGAVAWAYPVTVDRTPHHVTFSTGEQVYAA
jgi:hypothetical protein